MSEETAAITTDFTRKQAGRRRQQHERSRSELLEGGSRLADDDNIAALSRAHDSLTRSNSLVADYLAMGQQTIKSVRRQHDTLKSVQRRGYDLMNSLHSGGGIMNLIQRSETVTAFITYGLMILTVIIVALVYIYYR